MSLLDAALHLAANGCAVIPVANDGSKRPAVDWKTYQQTPPPRTQLDAWFTDETSYDGLGVVTGAVSGHLEMLEVEGRAIRLVSRLNTTMADAGLAELWSRLCKGWLEQSPSGGIHWHYRVAADQGGGARGNTKLARRRNPDLPRVVDVLIETRGEGGFTVVSPSHGRAHPTGQAWMLLAGGADTCPTITVEERDALYAVATQLDEMPVEAGPRILTPPSPTGAGPAGGTNVRPGDDYNARADWSQILEPHGWRRTKRMGDGWGWTRPGKSPRDGISATTGTAADGVDRLYVFSTSTEFETEQPYSKFGAYAVLEHAGDHTVAARTLRGDGYGDQTPPAERTLTLVRPPADPTQPPGQSEQQPEPPQAPPSSPPAPGVFTGATVHQLRPQTATRTVADSEDAHAQRLIAGYGDLIRYVPARKAWITWSGARWVWQPPGGGIVREHAKNIARGLTDSDAALPQRRKALSAAGISGCLRQAETDARVVVDMGTLDANPYTLNTPAGLVDLRTGVISDPVPETLCTKTTVVAPAVEPDPIWQRFLDETFAGDKALEGYVQRLVGVTLLGVVREQLLAFLHGIGANGKSTLAETLMHALGVGETGYAIAAPAEMLMIRKHSEHPAELAQLAGARMVVCSELDEGQRFAEAKIKQLTGRDSINARFLYGQPFTFTPTHTLWLLGNHRPQARTGGLAFWRRVKLVEFLHVVPVEQRDAALGDKLNAAAGTVLAWAIAGAVDYLAGGMREPVVVEQATASYAADQDTVKRFVDDSCHRASSDVVRVPVGAFRTAYEAWCREAGEEAVSARRLTQELRDRFEVGEQKSNGKRFYTRICILEPDADDTEPHVPATSPPEPPPDGQPALEPPTSDDPWALPDRDGANDVWQP